MFNTYMYAMFQFKKIICAKLFKDSSMQVLKNSVTGPILALVALALYNT